MKEDGRRVIRVNAPEMTRLKGDFRLEVPAKFDTDKPRPELIPPEALMAAARAFTYGAQKYGAGNWSRGEMLPLSRLFGALQRHLWSWWSGVEVDADSGLGHLDHALASLAMLVATQARGGCDDRAEVGAAAVYGSVEVER